MIRKKLLIGTLVMSALVGTIGCAQYNAEGQEENKAVTVIKETKDILATEVVASKIDTYEGVIGYDWLDENKVVITKENKALKPIKIDNAKLKADFEIKNMYSYNLDSKEEKSIGDQSKFQDGAIFSPNHKHMFYRNEYEKQSTGYIVNSQNDTEVKISDPSIDEYDLSEAQWINNEELIMPCNSIKGFAIVNIDGTITKIKDVESGVMGTKDPLNGLSITNPMKVGDKIYYVTIHRGADDDDKIKVYDMNKKEKKELMKDEVQGLSLSPNKEQLLILTSNLEKNVNELIVTDLEGKEREVLAEGYIFGATWSHDGTKVAYISNEEGHEGVSVVDLKTKKESLISIGEYYIPIAWSPSDKKIMVHGTKSKNNGRPFDEIDVTNVITLK
ncbi:PD40 domain-containing protein [Lutibacter sp. B2]|nr:PD40 domain-containing protein [Lutibacter sp. B2]